MTIYVRDQFFAKNGNNSKVSEHLVLKTSSDYDMRSECKHKLSHMLLHIDIRAILFKCHILEYGI